MGSKSVGKQSVAFENPPYVAGCSSIVGKKEGEGPLGSCFDYIEEDPMFGGSTWEDAESRLQKKAAETAIEKAGLKKSDIRYLLAGDLLGQLIASSFGVMDLEIPFFGIYGACSTMGEAISLGAMLIDGGYADYVEGLTSSHNASAERQFRLPAAYGSQKPLSSTWTVTGSGAVILSSKRPPDTQGADIVIKGVTTGRIVDYGVKDSMNMGACMAPAAYEVIYRNLSDFKVMPDYYDKIITGDLGAVGQKILIELLKEKGYDISKNHIDCGMLIYDGEEQDTHAGGSGCGCSAVTLTGYVMKKLRMGEWRRVLFVPTGALLSPVSFNEGNSVPGIAHGIILESLEYEARAEE